ncbi:MAG: hypothetical protein FWF78_04780, partial [Defluviitaleaceae bacterium]|nr:hypothetical protein [Defluviitaleaceae bacterium]
MKPTFAQRLRVYFLVFMMALSNHAPVLADVLDFISADSAYTQEIPRQDHLYRGELEDISDNDEPSADADLVDDIEEQDDEEQDDEEQDDEEQDDEEQDDEEQDDEEQDDEEQDDEEQDDEEQDDEEQDDEEQDDEEQDDEEQDDEEQDDEEQDDEDYNLPPPAFFEFFDINVTHELIEFLQFPSATRRSVAYGTFATFGDIDFPEVLQARVITHRTTTSTPAAIGLDAEAITRTVFVDWLGDGIAGERLQVGDFTFSPTRVSLYSDFRTLITTTSAINIPTDSLEVFAHRITAFDLEHDTLIPVDIAGMAADQIETAALTAITDADVTLIATVAGLGETEIEIESWAEIMEERTATSRTFRPVIENIIVTNADGSTRPMWSLALETPSLTITLIPGNMVTEIHTDLITAIEVLDGTDYLAHPAFLDTLNVTITSEVDPINIAITWEYAETSDDYDFGDFGGQVESRIYKATSGDIVFANGAPTITVHIITPDVTEADVEFIGDFDFADDVFSVAYDVDDIYSLLPPELEIRVTLQGLTEALDTLTITATKNDAYIIGRNSSLNATFEWQVEGGNFDATNTADLQTFNAVLTSLQIGSLTITTNIVVTSIDVLVSEKIYIIESFETPVAQNLSIGSEFDDIDFPATVTANLCNTYTLNIPVSGWTITAGAFSSTQVETFTFAPSFDEAVLEALNVEFGIDLDFGTANLVVNINLIQVTNVSDVNADQNRIEVLDGTTLTASDIQNMFPTVNATFIFNGETISDTINVTWQTGGIANTSGLPTGGWQIPSTQTFVAVFENSNIYDLTSATMPTITVLHIIPEMNITNATLAYGQDEMTVPFGTQTITLPSAINLVVEILSPLGTFGTENFIANQAQNSSYVIGRNSFQNNFTFEWQGAFDPTIVSPQTQIFTATLIDTTGIQGSNLLPIITLEVTEPRFVVTSITHIDGSANLNRDDYVFGTRFADIADMPALTATVQTWTTIDYEDEHVDTFTVTIPADMISWADVNGLEATPISIYPSGTFLFIANTTWTPIQLQTIVGMGDHEVTIGAVVAPTVTVVIEAPRYVVTSIRHVGTLETNIN